MVYRVDVAIFILVSKGENLTCWDRLKIIIVGDFILLQTNLDGISALYLHHSSHDMAEDFCCLGLC